MTVNGTSAVAAKTQSGDLLLNRPGFGRMKEVEKCKHSISGSATAQRRWDTAAAVEGLNHQDNEKMPGSVDSWNYGPAGPFSNVALAAREECRGSEITHFLPCLEDTDRNITTCNSKREKTL
jgi:hypothetical protein